TRTADRSARMPWLPPNAAAQPRRDTPCRRAAGAKSPDAPAARPLLHLGVGCSCLLGACDDVMFQTTPEIVPGLPSRLGHQTLRTLQCEQTKTKGEKRARHSQAAADKPKARDTSPGEKQPLCAAE